MSAFHGARNPVLRDPLRHTHSVASVQALVDMLRNLSAEKFPASGFTTLTLELTVSSNDSKRIKKVSVAKSRETHIAKVGE